MYPTSPGVALSNLRPGRYRLVAHRANSKNPIFSEDIDIKRGLTRKRIVLWLKELGVPR